MTLKEYLHNQYTRQTADSYIYHINHFLATNRGTHIYMYEDIINYIRQQQQKQAKPAYINMILAAIKKYYDYLIFTGQREDHPCKSLRIKGINRHIQTQDLFSSDELQLLLTRENRYKHLDTRNKVIIGLLIYQGLTSEEITRLNVSNVDLDKEIVYVKASRKLHKRHLELVSGQLEVLDEYIDKTRKPLLREPQKALILTKKGRPITVDSIHAMIEPMKVLFPDRNLNPKTIRMSIISNWLNEKRYPLEYVQQLAGHRYPSSTEKYLRRDVKVQVKLINTYHPLG